MGILKFIAFFCLLNLSWANLSWSDSAASGKNEKLTFYHRVRSAGLHVWNSFQISRIKAFPLLAGIKVKSITGNTIYSGQSYFNSGLDPLGRLSGTLFPYGLAVATGTLARMFNSSSEELKIEMEKLDATQNPRLGSESETQTRVQDFLTQAKEKLDLLGGSLNDPNYSIEQRELMRLQYSNVFSQLRITESQFQNFIQSQIRIRTDQSKLTFGQMMDSDFIKRTTQVTLSDIQSDPILSLKYHQLNQSIEIATSLVLNQTHEQKAILAKDCSKTLATRPEEFQKELLSLAYSTKRHPLRAHEYIEYFYGEPGNGKSSSFIEAAKCQKIPYCFIDSEMLDDLWDNSENKNIQDLLKNLMIGCMTGINTNGEPIELSFPTTFKSYYPHESKLPTSIASGWIIWDDIEEFLNHVLETTETNDPINPYRIEMMRFFKNISERNRTSFSAPITGTPTLVAAIKNILVGNEPLAEFNETSVYYFPELKPHWKSYMVPYATPTDRENILNIFKEDFFENELKGITVHSSSTLATCNKKFDEILAYDVANYKLRQGALGVRGLICLKDGLLGQIKSVTDLFLQGLLSDNEICDHPKVRDFDVAAAGGDCPYQPSSKVSLKEDQLSQRILEFQVQSSPLLHLIPNEKLRAYLNQKIIDLSQGHLLGSIETRQKIFRDLKKQFRLASDRIETKTNQLKEINIKLQDQFAYLKGTNGSWTSDGEAIVDLANEIVSTLYSNKNRHRIILIDNNSDFKSPFDSEYTVLTLRTLADSIGIPFCIVDQDTDFFEFSEKDILNWQSSKTLEFLTVLSQNHETSLSKEYHYNEKYQAYVFQDSEHTALAKIDHFGNVIENRWTHKEFAKVSGGLKYQNWWNHCLNQWEKGSAQGMIYISLSDSHSSQKLHDILDQLEKAIDPNGFLREDDTFHDLSKISVVFDPHNNAFGKEWLQKLKTSHSSKYFVLPVSASTSRQRTWYINSLLNSSLKKYGDVDAKRYLQKYSRTFEEIIRNDEVRFKEDTALSLDPLVISVQEFILKSIEEGSLDLFKLNHSEGLVTNIDSDTEFNTEFDIEFNKDLLFEIYQSTPEMKKLRD